MPRFAAAVLLALFIVPSSLAAQASIEQLEREAATLRAEVDRLKAMDRAAAQGKDAVDQDLELHSAIAEATGNPQFPRFLQFIGRHLIPRRIVSGMPQSMGGREAYLKLLQAEHQAIVEAIQQHDPKAAREAMRRHLTRSVERYRKLAAEQKAAA